jgi:predicted metalloprotease with PDZ domain
MNTEDRSRRLRLLADSQRIAARRRPTVLYLVLAVLAMLTFSYEVRLTYQNFPQWFGRTDAARRPFFADASGTEPIRISFLNNEAADAGLKSGDELVSINGKLVVGTAVFGDAMRAARAVDKLRVTVRRAGETSDRTASITLRSGGGRQK